MIDVLTKVGAALSLLRLIGFPIYGAVTRFDDDEKSRADGVL